MSLDKKQLTMLVIACAEGDGLSPVQLQKTLFLIGESGVAGLPSENYEFVPYSYGPFNLEVYEDVGSLVDEGMVASAEVPGRDWSKYVVTSTGLEYIKTIEAEIGAALHQYVQEVVDWVKRQSFSGLLRAIYAKYPQYRENSVFQG